MSRARGVFFSFKLFKNPHLSSSPGGGGGGDGGGGCEEEEEAEDGGGGDAEKSVEKGLIVLL